MRDARQEEGTPPGWGRRIWRVALVLAAFGHVLVAAPGFLHAEAIPLHLGAALLAAVLWSASSRPTLRRSILGVAAVAMIALGLAAVKIEARRLKREVERLRSDRLDLVIVRPAAVGNTIGSKPLAPPFDSLSQVVAKRGPGWGAAAVLLADRLAIDCDRRIARPASLG